MPLVESCISLQNRTWAEPNQFNRCLDMERAAWRSLIECQAVDTRPGYWLSRGYRVAPWVEMPPEGERLQKGGSIPLPADDGLDHQIFEFTLPVGWDGVFANIMFQYTGVGFVEGSGDITWRLKVGNRYIPDFSAVQFSLSDLKFPYELVGGYVRLLSLQRVQFFVNILVGASARLAGGRINAAGAGWQYPKR